MGVTANKAAAITNRDATPAVLTNANLSCGMLRQAVGQLEALTTDSVGSTYRMAMIPSNARISSVLISCDAATAGAFDIGLYKTTADGGAVVSVALYGSAVSVAAALVDSNITHESGTYGIEKGEMMVWQALGLSEDPRINYDVALTTTTVMTAQATIALKVSYAL